MVTTIGDKKFNSTGTGQLGRQINPKDQPGILTFEYTNATSLGAGATGINITLTNIWFPKTNVLIRNIFAFAHRVDNATSPFTLFDANGYFQINNQGVNAQPVGWNNGFTFSPGSQRFLVNNQYKNLSILISPALTSFVFSVSWTGAALATDSLSYSVKITYEY